MSNLKQYLSKLLNKGDGGEYPPKLQNKKLLWLAGVIALAVALLIIGNSGEQKKEPELKAAVRENTQLPSKMGREEEILATKLRQMLSLVDGAGQVEVTVRLCSSAREEYAVNTTTSQKTTEEKDQGGGRRTIMENTDSGQLVLIRNGQGETPVVERESAAQIAGVLVVAEGAHDPQVKVRLFRAVQVALGLEPHKILVLPKERGGQNVVNIH